MPNNQKPSTAFHSALQQTAQSVEQVLSNLLPLSQDPESKLIEAMRYGVLGGGKRLRPFLVAEVAELFEVKPKSAILVGAAIEIIHGYSLIHDDLPCMDDDAMRRGKPSLHVAFGEAMAVLAGDGLLTLAFEILASEEVHKSTAIRVELLQAMAHAGGVHGMVGGQSIDLQNHGALPELGILTRLHGMKTGSLIHFAVDSGAILGQASKEDRAALGGYAQMIGLAFQIIDDLLDYKESDSKKTSFVALMGEERAREQAAHLVQQAKAHLVSFGKRADMLCEIADFVQIRES